MTTGEQTFRALQAAARSTGAKTRTPPPTQEYLIRHLLESFLDRLTRTSHGDDYVLKGGILLAAYGVRRPTRDADANAISAEITTEHLTTVIRDIAAVDTPDGVVFDVESITIQQIREHADYPGYRVRVQAAIGPWTSTAAWDVSTGDPIIPAPRTVHLDRLLGDPIELLGCTRDDDRRERRDHPRAWHHQHPLAGLHRYRPTRPPRHNTTELRRSAEAVAHYRGVALEPVSPHLAGYGQIGQTRWSAWRQKEHLEAVSEELIDDQVALVAEILDPVFRPAPSTQ